MALDPRRRRPDPIGVGGVGGVVRDPAHPREPLDIPRIVQLEGSEREAFSRKCGLVRHGDDSNTVPRKLPNADASNNGRILPCVAVFSIASGSSQKIPARNEDLSRQTEQIRSIRPFSEASVLNPPS